MKLLGESRFSVIAKEKVIVRLGESPSQIKHLTEEAILRGIEAMKLLALVAERTGSPVRAVATSAVREASNAEDFIERVEDETGVEIEVISGFEEARLIYLGVLQGLPVFNEKIAFFDIGGGSTEFLVGRQGRILYANSFKIGAIRMTQRFFPNERVTPEQIEACRLYIRSEIYHAAEEIKRHGISRMIATSGTAQTIAAMVIAARGAPVPESLNDLSVTRREIRDTLARILKARSFTARAALPGVDPRRADILVAGAITLATIIEDCGAESVTISSYALREGIILDTIQKMEGERKGTAHLSDLRFETVMKIGKMFDFDFDHGQQVARLALSIYDALAPLHGLEEVSREHLEAAALLHDIGYYISHASHHKHSYYLIRNTEVLGFNNEEIAVIANVARYHRKSHPKARHPEFAELRGGDQQRVRILAAILRLADAFDRTHKNNIERIETSYDDLCITLHIHPHPGTTATFERWSAERKKELLEDVFKRRVVIESDEEELAESANDPMSKSIKKKKASNPKP